MGEGGKHTKGLGSLYGDQCVTPHPVIPPGQFALPCCPAPEVAASRHPRPVFYGAVPGCPAPEVAALTATHGLLNLDFNISVSGFPASRRVSLTSQTMGTHDSVTSITNGGEGSN
ncbi:unnamed protein product [Lepidochelys kempii]